MPRHVLDPRSLTEMAALAEYRPGNLAKLSGREPWELRREIQRCFGCSTRAWLDRERWQRVESLLLSGDLWVKEAAPEVFFKHCSSFCRAGY
jgi:AraC-like DNA-binding protein